jgi:hypothetical protein
MNVDCYTAPAACLPVASEDHAEETYEWLSKGSSRIWRGSLANNDWRHLGKGAWQPKQSAVKQNKKQRSHQPQQPRGRPPKQSGRAQPANSKRSRPSLVKDGKLLEKEIDIMGHHFASRCAP